MQEDEKQAVTINESLKTISFAERMVASDAFMALFREGMALVEETAAYLDGQGRVEAKALERMASLAYASESMRLTTRLMQMTSWLLLQRAVNEGELSRSEAEREHQRVKLAPQGQANSSDMIDVLPEGFQALVERSLRLQERIHRLDCDLQGKTEAKVPENPIARQLDTLTAAFRRN